ncbi:hydroxymethylglutaryl-CoA lyase [Meiothermus granaticius]|uniref:Hydroxymethylglutaryl-CoA lyase YngG n=1 Tax=Meiothermus granaticius NBRC 107808 TaxID=1227551 RepID=A0A399FAR5_9DEIN|nr:hydroxymethylglutaryl-CoA lyase [Meiothermus granaticius]MCL6525619.1 hydroxymethylglutaryl-CoA lyase [Thermaceae bacterium]RIH93727.1 Hydroxymethylglutaryl-CoA lyase YngG [Meiothermus granaticius NBRC 107808]GEM85750.1 hydroxymethylglutaryl-CoA lyase [Meiothermus granaticius NBRC 107808]
MKWVECPRDSWQGFAGLIPTEVKVAYLKRLLEAGFSHLDLTSLVSPHWVPQHADAERVLAQLPAPEGREYLVIVANEKGLERALAAPQVTSVGYPFSISETFQRKNLNRGIAESWAVVARMAEQAQDRLRFVVYLSMGFGNPYGDPWSPDLPVEFVGRLRALGIREIALADTYGVATAQTIGETLSAVAQVFGPLSLGAHLHSRPEGTLEKVQAVLDSGIRWLEGALGGIGGCPFAGDSLVGNLASETVIPYLEERGLGVGVRLEALQELAQEAARLRAWYG